MKPFFCYLGNHDFKVVAVNDNYHTQYTHTKQKKFHNMRFYQCVCGARKFYTDYPSSTYSKHRGIDEAKKNWIDLGVVPSGSLDPRNDSNYVKVDQTPEESIDPLKELTKTVDALSKQMMVIRRDFDLENKYSSLRTLAEKYERERDKLSQLEFLKGNDKHMR